MNKQTFAVCVALNSLLGLHPAVYAADPATNAAPAAALPSVAFQSDDSRMVPGDKNSCPDIFVCNGPTRKYERVSVASDGTEANAPSAFPSISADGRYVAFASEASNLVPGDKNGYADIFVHDRQTHKTERVSVASDGTEANQNSWHCAISADGRYVAFESYATNLAPGPAAEKGEPRGDVYVHDRQTHKTERVSVTSEGVAGNRVSEKPSVSADGRFVAFQSTSILAPGGSDRRCSYVHDRQTHKTEVLGVEGIYGSPEPVISGDGRYVAYQSCPGNKDSPGYNIWQMHVHDRQTGQDALLSAGLDKAPGNGPSMVSAISADGRYVAFLSEATNLVADGKKGPHGDVYVYDCQGHKIERAIVGQGWVRSIQISADGRYVAIMDVSAIFVYDRQTKLTSLVANPNAANPAIAACGK